MNATDNEALSEFHMRAAFNQVRIMTSLHQQHQFNLDEIHPRDNSAALHRASRGNAAGAIRWLVSNGADINLKKTGVQSFTPIEETVYHGAADAFINLVELGADCTQAEKNLDSIIFTLQNRSNHSVLRSLMFNGTALSLSEASKMFDYLKAWQSRRRLEVMVSELQRNTHAPVINKKLPSREL